MAGIDSARISKVARNISTPEPNVYYMHHACEYVIFFRSCAPWRRSARIAPPGRLHALSVPCRRCCSPWAVPRARSTRAWPGSWLISRLSASYRPRRQRIRPTARSGARAGDFGAPTRASGRRGRSAAGWPAARLPHTPYTRASVVGRARAAGSADYSADGRSPSAWAPRRGVVAAAAAARAGAARVEPRRREDRVQRHQHDVPRRHGAVARVTSATSACGCGCPRTDVPFDGQM